MRVILHTDASLTLRDFDQPDFVVESEAPDAHYSALPMFATSLGLCTFAVVAEYAKRFQADTADMEIDLDWDYVDDPYRIGNIDMVIRWPQVPEERLRSVERAATLCTIHNTLHHPPEISTRVVRSGE